MGKSGTNRSIYEILGLTPTDRKKEYEAENIHKVIIDGNEYTNYGQYRFIWEKTYPVSPTRTIGGVIGGLNTLSTFLVGHLYMDFSIMSIDDYRKIMQQHYSRNEFTVTCYDVIYDKSITLKMYFATEQVAKLRTIANNRLKSDGTWENWVDLVGVDEYTVEMIGTNSSLDSVSVVYHLNPPTSTGLPDQTIGGEELLAGGYFVMGSGATYDYKNETFNGQYKFKNWKSTDSNGTTVNYLDGNTYQLTTKLDLYAVWETTSVLTLNFSYGLGVGTTLDNYGFPIQSKQVQNGVAIGELPTFDTPKVGITEDKKTTYYDAYQNGGWYTTSIKGQNSTPVTKNTPYWSNYNSTIYLLFDKIKHTVTFDTQDANLSVGSLILGYQDALALPTLYKKDYNFKGWFITEQGGKVTDKQFSSNLMPPYNLLLTAKWEEIKNG